MGQLRFVVVALLGLPIASTASAAADELADKLCPLLKEARELDSPIDIQMRLVMGLAGAYEDPADLGALPPKADAAAEASCPDDRAEVLKRSEAQSLEGILR
jgi:hypothetical protein